MTSFRAGAAALLRRLRRHKLEVCVVSATLAVVTIIWAAALNAGTRAQQEAADRALSDASGRAGLWALQWKEELTKIQWLHALAREVVEAQQGRDHNGDERANELRRALKLAGPEIILAAILDPAGKVIWSTTALRSPALASSALDVAALPSFQAIAAAGQNGAVGTPSRDLMSGKFAIPFVEAMRDRNGGLIAVTLVALDVEALKSIAAAISVAAHEVTSLISPDGILLMRSDGEGDGANLIGEGRHLFEEASRNGISTASGPSLIDGVKRFYGARRVDGFGVVAIVGLEQDEELASARRAAAQGLYWATVIAAALGVMTFAILLSIVRHRNLREERRRLAKFAERDALLRQIAKHATDIVALYDADLKVIFVNAALRTVLGIEKNRLIGRRFGANAVAADLPLLEAAVAKVIELGASQRVVFRSRHADGSCRWLEMEMVDIDADQRRERTGCHYISITRDVTGRIESEGALREMQAQVQTLLRLGTGLLCRRIVRLSALGGPYDHHEVAISALAPRLAWGYTHQELTAPGFFLTRVHPEDAKLLADAIRQCGSAGEAAVEYRFQNAEGEYRWMREQMTLADNAPGRQEIVVYVTDITVEHNVRARMQQMSRLSMLGEVTTNIAHEIHQPLAVIAMAAENALRTLERDGESASEVKAKLSKIMDQTHRISKVIDHVRMFGRHEKASGVELSVYLVVDQAAMLAEARLRASKVTLTIDLPSDLPNLIAPRIPLEQALLNIIVNACDAYDQNASTAGVGAKRPLRLSARHESDFVIIRVADRAGGIPAGALSRVFEPYFTTKPPGVGTGIGLSVSNANIQEMGGALSAYNESGGAVFVISLPLNHAPPIHIDAPAQLEAL